MDTVRPPATNTSIPIDEAMQKHVADNMRFYADARFKQLTLFLSWNTLIAAGLFQFGAQNQLAKDLNLSQVLPFVATLVTAVFWIMEVRASLYWRTLRDMCPEVWPRPPKDIWRSLNATVAVFVLHTVVYAIWWSALWSVGAKWWLWLPSLLVGLVVLVFGLDLYLRYSSHGSTLRKDQLPGK